MTVHAILGQHEAHTLKQLDDIASRAEHVALMADGHLGYIANRAALRSERKPADVGRGRYVRSRRMVRNIHA